MERLPFDIQDIIYEKVHKLQFDEVLKELPLKLWAFNYMMDETMKQCGFDYMMDDTTLIEDQDDDEDCPINVIDELWDYYYDQLSEIEKRFEELEDLDKDYRAYKYQHDMYDKWNEGKIKMGVLAKTLHSDIRNGTLRITFQKS